MSTESSVDANLTPRGNNFNLLRLTLASLVLTSHCFELIDGNRNREILTRVFHTLSLGEFAVNGFFLLSGFLIVGSFIRNPEPVRYLTHRSLRIFPGFLVCAFICLLVIGPLGANPGYFYAVNLKMFFLGLLTFSVQGLPPVFLGSYYPAINVALWTLLPEFLCYVLVLISGWIGLFRKKIYWVILWCALFLLYELGRYGFQLIFFNVPIDFHYAVIRLTMFFVAGGILRMVDNTEKLRFRYVAPAIGILIAGMFSKYLAEPVMSVLGGYILVFLARKESALLSRLRMMPDISYGTYLYGWPTQKLLILFIPSIEPTLLLAISLPLAWMAGALSWYGVESKALKLKL